MAAVVGAALAAPVSAWSGGKGAAGRTKSEQDQAQEHFRKAREHYSAGRYRAAITELELAYKLDPSGAELVYNLGLIHEKMAEVDDAIRYYRRYMQMIDDDAEKARIEGVIRRLEGAKEEVVAPAASSEQPAVAPPPASSAPPKKGRADGWVIGTGAVAGAALLAGGYFGYKAWSDRVEDPPSTGPGRSIGDLQDQADRAHREAVIADIGFGVALVAGATSMILYLARDATPVERAPDGPVEARVTPTLRVLPHGMAAGIGIGF